MDGTIRILYMKYLKYTNSYKDDYFALLFMKSKLSINEINALVAGIGDYVEKFVEKYRV